MGDLDKQALAFLEQGKNAIHRTDQEKFTEIKILGIQMQQRVLEKIAKRIGNAKFKASSENSLEDDMRNMLGMPRYYVAQANSGVPDNSLMKDLGQPFTVNLTPDKNQGPMRLPWSGPIRRTPSNAKVFILKAGNFSN